MSFRLKAILGILLIEASFLVLLLWMSLGYLYGTNEDQLTDRAHATADLIVAASSDAVLGHDLATLQRIVDESAQNRLVERIEVFDGGGVLLAADEATTHDEELDHSLELIQGDADIEFYGQNYGRVVVTVSSAGILEMLEQVAMELIVVALLALFAVAFLSYLLGNWLVHGIAQIQLGLHKFAEGEVIRLPEGKDELGQLSASFNKMVSSLTSETKRAERFQRQAQFDSLTGLLSRDYLLSEMQIMMKKAIAEETLLAVVYMDLNRFKAVNDEHGHAVGDHILSTIAHRLQVSFRDSDRLFRVGGDEFVLLLGNLRSVMYAEELLLRAMGVLYGSIQCPDCQPIQISASMGVVYYPLNECDDAAEILSEADRAMYAAKQGPAPYLRIYETSMRERRAPVPIDSL